MTTAWIEGDDEREKILRKLSGNRELAHSVLFRHRHKDETPAFHRDVIDLWHSDKPRVVVMAFRGGGKSTIAEEAFIVEACLRRFRNGLVLGASRARAVERLTAIKHELTTNPYIEDMFGELQGPVWNEDRILLNNGVMIQALGRGQSLRGAKYLDQRPDRVLGDDLETEEDVASPEARQKAIRWLMASVLPALAPEARVRIVGTPLDQQSVIVQIAADKDWTAFAMPIEHKGPDGERVAAWPSRFPLAEIDAIRERMARRGLQTEFAQEYMCVAEDPTQKAFTAGMMPAPVPLVRTWQPVYAMVDPARTVGRKSATTGVAVWSWVANRLVLWDAYARRAMPDEIVSDIFEVDDKWRPIAIGVEADGLEEFIMQPLRQEQVKRGYAVPIRAMRAPKGKLDFIKGLQPFFKAGEVQFAKPLPDLVSQLMGFPSGEIDVPNALAYALRLRPGAPIYEDFTDTSIDDTLHARKRGNEWLSPPWLAVNARDGVTTAILVQLFDDQLDILADWVREGDPGVQLQVIAKEAALEVGKKPVAIAPPEHFTAYDRIGLKAAARGADISLQKGGMAASGREELRSRLARRMHGLPMLRINPRARWTLNAFAGGYARDVLKSGALSDYAVDGAYKVLMEGLESFAAMMARLEDNGDRPTMALSANGRSYMTSRA